MSGRDGGPRIAVVVLTYKQEAMTLACLESLAKIDDIPFHVLVWDNDSQDGTADAVRKAYPSVAVHVSDENLGVASGRNAGAKRAAELFDPDLLLFLDNDMDLDPRFVSALAEPFSGCELGKVGQTQAKLRLMDRPDVLNDGGGVRITFWNGQTRHVGFGERDEGQYDRMRRIVSCGGAMMVRRDLFERLGGFDAAFDPFGPEDLDFSLRLQKLGYVAVFVPEAVAYHKISHTFGGGDFSSKYAEHKTKHWFVFMRRHATFFQRASFYGLGVPLIGLRILVREARRGNFSVIWGLLRGLGSSLRRS